MRMSAYVKEYTSGRRIVFADVLDECRELLVEIAKCNKAGIQEELGDVFHFLQAWLFWRFGLDGELWKITHGSTQKFINRVATWRKIYEFAFNCFLPTKEENTPTTHSKVKIKKITFEL